MHWEKKKTEGKAMNTQINTLHHYCKLPFGWRAEQPVRRDILKPLENYNKLTKDHLTFLAAVPNFQM